VRKTLHVLTIGSSGDLKRWEFLLNRIAQRNC